MEANDPRHGTNAGHRAHISDKTPICQPCREAHNAYRRGLWRRKYLLRCDRLYIESTGTIRRIRALQALGWRLTDIDAALGHGDGATRGGPNYAHNLTRQTQVHRDTAAKVARVYEELSMRHGPSDRTRALARKYGWPPPLAWDDIDDPTERPNLRATRPPKSDVDEAVVLRVMAGERLPMTTGERVEVVARLRARRWSLNEIEAHTGIGKPERYIEGRAA